MQSMQFLKQWKYCFQQFPLGRAFFWNITGKTILCCVSLYFFVLIWHLPSIIIWQYFQLRPALLQLKMYHFTFLQLNFCKNAPLGPVTIKCTNCKNDLDNILVYKRGNISFWISFLHACNLTLWSFTRLSMRLLVALMNMHHPAWLNFSNI